MLTPVLCGWHHHRATGEEPAAPPLILGRQSPRPCPPQHLSLASSQTPSGPPVPNTAFAHVTGPRSSRHEAEGTLVLGLAVPAPPYIFAPSFGEVLSITGLLFLPLQKEAVVSASLAKVMAW